MGSGKSTLSRLSLAFEPSEGAIDTVDKTNDPADTRKNIGIMLQELAFPEQYGKISKWVSMNMI